MEKEIKEFFKTTSPKKYYGQNFLTDKNIIGKIITKSDLTKNDVIIEVGAGLGSLTFAMSPLVKKVIAIEIDKSLVPMLKSKATSNVEIIKGDVLKLDVNSLIAPYENVKIIANLPYYITTAIINKFLTAKVQSLTFMMQKEVGERLIARPNTKSYGSLSIALQYLTEITLITKVSRSCFYPKPTVDSVVLNLTPRPYHLLPENEDFFFALVRCAFGNRRKTLVNSLITGDFEPDKSRIIRALTSLGLKENVRAQELGIENYVQLADLLINREF